MGGGGGHALGGTSKVHTGNKEEEVVVQVAGGARWGWCEAHQGRAAFAGRPPVRREEKKGALQVLPPGVAKVLSLLALLVQKYKY
jgi:hypothetical protein